MQVYPRTARFKDMSSEIEVELAAFSLTVIATAPASAPGSCAVVMIGLQMRLPCEAAYSLTYAAGKVDGALPASSEKAQGL